MQVRLTSLWRHGIRVALAALMLALCCLAKAEPRRVLLINSFGREFAPFDAFAGHFRTDLIRQSPDPVDIYEVSLESARLSTSPEEGPIVEYLRAMFADRRLDLIVPVGGPAVRFAQKHRQQFFPATPMVLTAMDQRQLQTVLLTPNDAVVGVTNDMVRIVENILRLLPRTTNVCVVLGNSPVEQFWFRELHREFQSFSNRVDFVWLNELSFAEMVKRCAALPPRSAIFYVLLAVDAAGVPHMEERALASLRAAAAAPIFGLHDTQLGRGIVGGPLTDVRGLSRSAANVAVRILNGEKPGDLTTPPQPADTPTYDWRELQRWGIGEALLPTGSVIRFRQPNLWELHKWRIIAVVSLSLVEFLIIGLLMANLVKRRRAERSLRESEDRLNVAVAAGDIGVWVWNISDNQVWATENWRRSFGFPPDTVLTLDTMLEHIDPDDRVAVRRDMERAARNQTDYAGEFRVMRSSGELRWVAARGRLQLGDHGKPSRMLGALVDITERKQAEQTAREFGGRLLHAQEAERARLARELHDDITQRLARLAIDAGRIESGRDGTDKSETMREVRDGLVRLSEDVHSLSYKLHPALLEDLGLADALKAECERFTRSESIPVEMKLGPIPVKISPDTGLCLFRVTQEALRNVARHARSRAAKVSLRPLDDGLQLAVADAGIGFDPKQQRPRPSLGLASMRERVRLLGGELDIESAPGHGTTVVAWLPLKAREA